MGQSMMTAYVWALVVFIVFFLIAILISNMIPYKPNESGAGKRRIVFWVFAVLTFAVSFIINWGISSGIDVASIKHEYEVNTIIGSGAAFVLYVLIGLIISKAAPRTKVGTWF